MIPVQFVSMLAQAFDKGIMTKEQYAVNLEWYRTVNERLMLAHENVMHKALVNLDELAIQAQSQGETTLSIQEVRNVVVTAMRKYTPTSHIVGIG